MRRLNKCSFESPARLNNQVHPSIIPHTIIRMYKFHLHHLNIRIAFRLGTFCHLEFEREIEKCDYTKFNSFHLFETYSGTVDWRCMSFMSNDYNLSLFQGARKKAEILKWHRCFPTPRLKIAAHARKEKKWTWAENIKVSITYRNNAAQMKLPFNEMNQNWKEEIDFALSVEKDWFQRLHCFDKMWLNYRIKVMSRKRFSVAFFETRSRDDLSRLARSLHCITGLLLKQWYFFSDQNRALFPRLFFAHISCFNLNCGVFARTNSLSSEYAQWHFFAFH